MPENQQVIQAGVQDGGESKELHSKAGVLHGPLGAGINGREHIEHKGKANDPQIRRAQQRQVVAVGQQIHHLHGKQEEDRGQYQGQPAANDAGYPQRPADALHVALAPVLADENPKTALNAENDADKYKNRYVGRSDRRHFLISKLADHKGVNQPQRKGYQILQHHRQG